jgi:prevent-host-death family protein
MSTIANTHEAKTHLSGLIDRALHGEEIVIARDGVPCVRLAPVPAAAQARAGGEFHGRIRGDVLGPVGDDSVGAWG